jgi:hypothetical protein
MNPFRCVLIAMIISCGAYANDMMNQLTGEIYSTQEVRRVLPVRFFQSGEEIWMNHAGDWDYRPKDTGQNAVLRKNEKIVNWEWTISSSGGGGYLSDVVIHTANGTVYEVVEMNSPITRYKLHGSNTKDAVIYESVPNDYRQEFEKVKTACDVLISGRQNEAKVSQYKLMTFMEHSSTRSYLILINFTAPKSEESKWAVVRIMIDTDHSRTDIVRVQTDEEIKGHKIYQALPYFTLEESKASKRSINLDTVNLPSCRIEEQAPEKK